MTARGGAVDDDGRRGERVRRLGEAFVVDEAIGTLRHDLISHLTGIGNVTYLLRRRLTPQEGAKADDESTPDLLRMLREQVTQATAKLERRLVPPPDRAPQEADLGECATRAIHALHIAPAVAVEAVEPNVPVLAAADEIEIEIAIKLLLDNAVEATEEAGGGVVRVRCSEAGEGAVAIAIEDGGAGLSGERGSRAFEAFFTTKAGHLGLGLSVARRIAQRWAGNVEVTAGEHQGTRVKLRVPSGRRL